MIINIFVCLVCSETDVALSSIRFQILAVIKGVKHEGDLGLVEISKKK